MVGCRNSLPIGQSTQGPTWEVPGSRRIVEKGLAGCWDSAGS